MLWLSWPIVAILSMSPATAVDAQELTAREQINVGVAEAASPRNRTAGTIHLRGAPVPSRILAALLYFNFSDQSREGQRNVPILFDANVVVAEKTGDHDDPCWGLAGNHSYVADVTQLVPIGGHLNQDYRVVVQFDAETSTKGQNRMVAGRTRSEGESRGGHSGDRLPHKEHHGGGLRL